MPLLTRKSDKVFRLLLILKTHISLVPLDAVVMGCISIRFLALNPK
jgi:hypothetical protein